jgi:hypothetical protein
MSHRRPFTFPILVLTLAGGLAAVGCDQSGKTTMPPITAPSGGSATIRGTIKASLTVPPTSSEGATVQVLGTSSLTTVGGDQSFTLTNVPDNTNVVLQITGAGLNSLADLGLIRFADNVVVVFTRTNAILALNVTARTSDGTNIIGRISSLSPTDRSFIVLGRTVRTDPVTQYLRADGTLGSFFDLFEGLAVQVASVPGPSGAVVARVVQMESLSGGPAVNLTGAIIDLSGTSVSFTFVIRDERIRGDSSTTFASNMTFAALRNGDTIEVAGIRRSGFIQATQINVRPLSGTRK